ncbi:hypothetical protein SESBI_21316 [Sesbania bispinosa]|nr:hypothetical protein SESBI_21316 [Sesbania bispinosa]
MVFYTTKEATTTRKSTKVTVQIRSITTTTTQQQHIDGEGHGKKWITSAKHAEKALLANVPAKEMSDFEPPATMVKIQSKEKEGCVSQFGSFLSL